MPDKTPIPKIDDDTPDTALVYIKNKRSGAVGQCTVGQWRDLYGPSGKWEITTPDAHREHMKVLADEHTFIVNNSPDLLYPADGQTAAQKATSRSTSTTSSKEG